MTPGNQGNPAAGNSDTSQAAQHIASARDLLKSVDQRHGLLEKHPELAEVITKLELALNELTLETGGML